MLTGFKQFYGLTFKASIWGLLRAIVVGIVAFFVVMAVGVVFYEKGYQFGLFVLLESLLVVSAFFFAAQYLCDHESDLNPVVSLASKLLFMVLVYIIPFGVVRDIIMGLRWNPGYLLLTTIAVLYTPIATAVSLLPAYLQQKYHRIWLSLLPVAAFILIGILLKQGVINFA